MCALISRDRCIHNMNVPAGFSHLDSIIMTYNISRSTGQTPYIDKGNLWILILKMGLSMLHVYEVFCYWHLCYNVSRLSGLSSVSPGRMLFTLALTATLETQSPVMTSGATSRLVCATCMHSTCGIVMLNGRCDLFLIVACWMTNIWGAAFYVWLDWRIGRIFLLCSWNLWKFIVGF